MNQYPEAESVGFWLLDPITYSLTDRPASEFQGKGVGIGIHTGELSFGEFGRSHRDLSAIGTVVNLASRAQSAAHAGKILVTQAVYERSQLDLMGSPGEECQLKGFDAPVKLYAVLETPPGAA